jgi:hypothetical protein
MGVALLNNSFLNLKSKGNELKLLAGKFGIQEH